MRLLQGPACFRGVGSWYSGPSREPRKHGTRQGTWLKYIGARAKALLVILVFCNLQGCNRAPLPAPAAAANATESPQRSPEIIRPERVTLRHAIEQPGSIQAFEQTPIFSKIAGYVQKWHVDLGDRVKAGAILAELSVPELVEELQQKKALVTQAEKAFATAQARVATSLAQIREAEAGLSRAEANQKRWQLEKERSAKLSQRKIIDEQSDLETWNQYQSAAASLDEAQARVLSARAASQEMEAARDKAQADIGVAKAEQGRVAALVGYTQLRAPFDGIVTKRTIDTGHFVQPAIGAKTEPLFVVEKSDTVRVFVEVPETDTAWVHKGANASVRVPVLQNRTLTGKVTRTAGSLNRTSRTLLAEIDLPNPEGTLRPGMYAYATITAERPQVLTVPASAVATQGDITQGYQSFCFRVEDGKAWKTQVELGDRDNGRVELLKKRVKQADGSELWLDFTGDEQILQRPAESLKDGDVVKP